MALQALKDFCARIHQLILQICFVFCCFFPIYVIYDSHADFLRSKTPFGPDEINNVTICFMVSVILGVVLGTGFWAIYGSFDLLLQVLLLEILTNIILIFFSMIDTQYGYRLVIILLVLGILFGAMQITVTTYFGELYQGGARYTLWYHYLIFFIIHIVAYVLSHFFTTIPQQHHIYGTKPSQIDFFFWEFMLILLCSIIALILVLKIKHTAAGEEARTFKIERIQNINPKQLRMTFLLFCPLIFVHICVRLIHKQFMFQCQNVDPIMERMVIVCDYHLYIIEPFFMFLCMVLIMFAFKIPREDIFRIRLGCTLILLSIFISGYIHTNMEDSYYPIYRKILKTEGKARTFCNDGKDYNMKYPESGVFHLNEEIPIKFQVLNTIINVSLAWEQYNLTNLSAQVIDQVTLRKEYFAQQWTVRPFTFELGAEIWNIYHTVKNSDKTTFLQAYVYRRPIPMPIVFFIENQQHGQLKLISNHTDVIELTDFFFHQIVDGVYQLFEGNYYWNTYHFKRGGIYVVFLYRWYDGDPLDEGRDNITTVVTVIPAFMYNIFYLIPQYLLLAMGLVLIIPSVLELSYYIPSPTIKCEAIAALFLVYDIGYLLYFILYEVINSKVFYNYIMMVTLMITSICAIYTFEYIWDYQLSPNTKIETIVPKIVEKSQELGPAEVVAPETPDEETTEARKKSKKK